ncbi:MAG TPA: hypothetical protein VFC67_12535 [Prolixibacteraceae bacterium]|nr:hypothetical protein [Prolixibacteraceae bacterium]
MKSTKQLGIWMDHSTAHLVKIINGTIETHTIESQPEVLADADKQIVYKDESHSLNKEKRQLSSYYKELGDLILDNDEVVLFGPTDAKSELVNLLKENHLFDKIRIEVKPADKMTEIQRNVFVKEHFK